jgi:hypothetical protein
MLGGLGRPDLAGGKEFQPGAADLLGLFCDSDNPFRFGKALVSTEEPHCVL